MIEDREKPSLAIRIFGPLIFLLSAIAALSFFFYNAYIFSVDISSRIVQFDKGSFYMLGVGLGFLALTFAGIQETWLNKLLTNKQSSLFSKLAISGVVLTFTLPHVVHYVIDDYLINKGYSVCEEASHQWRFVRTIIYIHDSVECSKDLTNKFN